MVLVDEEKLKNRTIRVCIMCGIFIRTAAATMHSLWCCLWLLGRAVNVNGLIDKCREQRCIATLTEGLIGILYECTS